MYSDLVEGRTRRNLLLITCAAALALALTIALLQPARAAEEPPTVPTVIQVKAGNKLFEVGHATGTQNYICLPSATAASGFAFQLFTPQATLFKDADLKHQIMTHFFSPNPDEGGTVRPTWQDSSDSSTVWAAAVPGASVPQPNAIPWLLLKKVGAQAGPGSGDALTETTFIQRLNTTGGVAPSTGCASLSDVGNRAYVPYTADYYFYRAAGSE